MSCAMFTAVVTGSSHFPFLGVYFKRSSVSGRRPLMARQGPVVQGVSVSFCSTSI